MNERRNMKCSLISCPGNYEERIIVHTVRYRSEVVVIEHVPAEACSVCGDVLLAANTVRRTERMLKTT